MSNFTPSSKITLAEELILVMLSEETGYLDVSPGWQLSCVMAGALLADLALQGRIDTDMNSLYLVNHEPIGEELLDPLIELIHGAEKTFDTQYWIERTASKSDEIISTSLEHLVARKILLHELGGFYRINRTVTRSQTYPDTGIAVLQEAKSRIVSHLFDPMSIPEPRDTILVALLHSAEWFKVLFDEEDYEELLDRIQLLSKLDLIGRTVSLAVKESVVQLSNVSVSTKPVPKVQVRDILRIKAFRDGNLASGAHQLYSQYGSVMKLPIKFKGTPLYAMMGVEVNQWISKHSRFYLRTKEFIRDLENVYGASVSLVGSDGAPHYKLRKSMSNYYSRSAIGGRLPEMYKCIYSSLSQWKSGSALRMGATFKKHISTQMATLGFSNECPGFLDEVTKFAHRAQLIKGGAVLPEFLLHTPKMKRYKKHVHEFKEMVISTHTPGQRRGEPSNWADGFIGIHKNDPGLITEADLTFSFASSLFTIIYVGSALAFTIYSVLKNPDIHKRIYAEAEKLFGNGHLPAEEEFDQESIDVTQRLIMEAGRMYPVINLQLRRVVNRFVYNGYEVPPGVSLLVFQTASNYDESLFKDPLTFDIDRYLPDRAEHKQPGAYGTYGFGSHTCLGQRLFELQMIINLLIIIYHYDLEVVGNKDITMNPFPTGTPRKRFKIRIKGIRNPIPSV
ncbi:MAG: cytochrome P450 [Bacteroidetes bacterium]|nr:cytochrome P450 [Bacteroidota bacterium]MCY4233337.1 cytochrome P450 [Bacteroidota bacterium]